MNFNHFYSDPHFGHEPIIEFSNRPFTSMQDMTDDLVLRYNRQVKKEDLCLWVGDAFLMKSEPATDILDRLHGRKAIVLGNHDREPSWFLKRGFIFALDELVFHIGKTPVRVCHYPEAPASDLVNADRRYMERRPVLNAGQWLIHGHTHDTRRITGPRSIHVGVDAWDYRPVARDEVLAIIQKVGAE